MRKSLAALSWSLKQPAGGPELAARWLRDLELVLCRKALTGGLLREAGRVGVAHRLKEQGYLGKTLAALPCSEKPPLSGPAAWSELHPVGETYPVALF